MANKRETENLFSHQSQVITSYTLFFANKMFIITEKTLLSSRATVQVFIVPTG